MNKKTLDEIYEEAKRRSLGDNTPYYSTIKELYIEIYRLVSVIGGVEFIDANKMTEGCCPACGLNYEHNDECLIGSVIEDYEVL